MSRVEIAANGHRVEVTGDETAAVLVEIAEGLFTRTKPPAGRPEASGGTFGFTESSADVNAGRDFTFPQ